MKKYYKEELKEYDKTMNERYQNRKDKGNIFGVGISDSDFVKFAIDVILGPDWWAPSCVSGHDQVNEEALEAIFSKLGAPPVEKRSKKL